MSECPLAPAARNDVANHPLPRILGQVAALTLGKVQTRKRKLAMSMMQEFKAFALKGNVVDLAVGVIVGAAFGKIVDSLVKNILMPPIGYLMGGVNFADLAINLPTPTKPVLIKYGEFIQTIVDFTIIAFVLFLLIKGMNNMTKRMEGEQAAAPPPPPPQSEIYLKEIRDALAKR